MIGREKEQKILKDAYESPESQFIAVYGRRRIGKTYLVRETFQNDFVFSHTGIYGGSMKEQLKAFAASCADWGFPQKRAPSGWMDAFQLIKEMVLKSDAEKKVIFLDEMSWMDTAKSGFLTALEFFWNGWASARNDVLLVICASSTSWIVKKVIHNKGGLHNRLTRRIHLEPFHLRECEMLCEAYGFQMTRSEIITGYMIFGGVPYYWTLMERGKSLAQNIDSLCFGPNPVMKDEYRFLYASLFKNPDPYIRIVETLGKHRKAGMTRKDLVDESGLDNSGAFSGYLEELEQCGFIREYTEYGKKKKGSLFQLIDNFTLFYFKFMKEKGKDPGYWSKNCNSKSTDSWKGLAFERVCLEHLEEMKRALGISGIITSAHSFQCKENEAEGVKGSQIDLLIYRSDQVVNVCEMKYSSEPYAFGRADGEKLEKEISDFRIIAKPSHAVHPVLIAAGGSTKTKYSGMFQAFVSGDDLFREVY